MNFEELLDSRNGSAMRKEQMPFGMLYKKVKDNKYENVLTLRHELTENLVFCYALEQEAEQRQAPASSHEVPFTISRDSAGISSVIINKGSYRTFKHLMEETPAVVAKKNFINNTIDILFDTTERMHRQEIYHLCFAPDNILARRSDNEPMLLFHGSNYHRVGNYSLLFPGCEDFIAPEILEDGKPSATADIYSLGRFMEYLCRETGKTPELAHVIKKATKTNPDKRYQSVADMRRSLNIIRKIRKIIVWTVAAVVLALIGWAGWSSMQPQSAHIEYVPEHKEAEKDYLDPTTTEEEEYGLFEGYTRQDSLKLSPEEIQQREAEQKEHDAKAEEIFRKYFTRDAERILSLLYSPDNMAASETKYMAATQKAMAELVRAQTEIAERAGLSESRAQLIASQIIEQVTARKKTQQAMRQQTIIPSTKSSSSDDDSYMPSSSQSQSLGGTNGATSGSAGTTTTTKPSNGSILRHDPTPSEQRGMSGRERNMNQEKREMIKR